MIRRPPRSTLFPTRRSSDLDEVVHENDLPAIRSAMERYLNDQRVEALAFDYLHFYGNANTYARSEEHTSELQSRLHLVCRLLLEKKKPVFTTITRPAQSVTP